MKLWMQKKYNADYSRIAEQYGISEILAEILVKRGLHSWEAMNEYLYPSLEKMHSPSEMKGMEQGAQILREKIREKKKIGVIGDYDVDGIMSTTILCLGLGELGAQVEWRIPHRVEDGYGIRSYMAEEMKERGVDTLITCDNGISAMEAVVRAKELGMTVIITDHHEVPLDRETGQELLPPADAVIDPKQKDCAYPYPELCGSGVAYKLIQHLWGEEQNESLNKQLLSFAAVATVCDVVPLTGENRIIVKNGLEVLQCSDNVGMGELIRQLDFQREIGTGDLGFRIGPCLNASGRLEDASQGVRLLLEQEVEQAERLAEYLIRLNEERKEMTMQAVDQAVEVIEEEGYLKQPVMLVYLKNCQESVAGIVAGRIREKYYRPVMILTDSGEKLKGSGRSIPGYHMQEALNQCSDCLLEYGGHAMAAGFSLLPEQLEPLREALNRNCTLQEEDFIEKIYFDREAALGDVTREIVGELRLLQPVGEQNAGALFAKRGVEVCSVRIFGKEEQIGRFQVKEEGKSYTLVDFDIRLHMKKVICEKYSQQTWEELVAGRGRCHVDILYVPEINARYGDVQYRIIDCR